MNIGENIRKYRKLKGLTQPGLGKIIGKSVSTIQKYEANAVKPDFVVLDALADALDCSLTDLLKTNNDTENIDYLESYIQTLGYEIIADESEGYLILKSSEGEYEINESQLNDLFNSSKSFIQFKIQEIVNNSRKIGPI